MTLHQLRRAVGDAAFFTILRDWAAAHQYAVGTTAEFTALAESVSGQQLDELFQTWLYTPSKPVLAVPATLVTAHQPQSWPQISRTHELLAGRHSAS